MPIRLKSKSGRRGKLAAALDTWSGSASGTAHDPIVYTGRISALMYDWAGAIAGLYRTTSQVVGTLSTQLEHWTGEVTGTARSPNVAPFFARSFQEGSNGALISGFTQEDAGACPVAYSTAITGPFGESKVVRLDAKRSNARFGGTFSPWNISTSALLAEGDMWIRVFHRFPSTFCAGYSNTGGYTDGNPNVKWLRLTFGNALGGDDQRMTFEPGGFILGCGTTGSTPTFSRILLEGFKDSAGSPAGYASEVYWGESWAGPSHNWNNSGPVITRDVWHALQLHIHWGDTRATSYVRGWIDETYLGQPYCGASTLPTGSYLTGLVLGNYWNGTPNVDNYWYIANMIATRQTPTTLDSGGRPYIAPTTDARTWG